VRAPMQWENAHRGGHRGGACGADGARPGGGGGAARGPLPAALRVLRVDEPGLGLGNRDACYQGEPGATSENAFHLPESLRHHLNVPSSLPSPWPGVRQFHSSRLGSHCGPFWGVRERWAGYPWNSR